MLSKRTCSASVENNVGKKKVNEFAQSSLLTDRPGSLVGGVRSCEELPKEESCFSCSLLLRGLRLKKLFNFSVLLFRPGGLGGDALTTILQSGRSGIVSFC